MNQIMSEFLSDKPKKPPRAFAMPEIVNRDCLTLPYPVGVNDNNLYLTRMIRAKGSNKMIPMRVLTPDARRYHELVSGIAIAAKIPFRTGKVKIILNIFQPADRGDLLGSNKAALDALKGIAWIDDRQIKRAELEYFLDRANPRLEIEIEPFGPQQLLPCRLNKSPIG